jgi:hypothetical protein
MRVDSFRRIGSDKRACDPLPPVLRIGVSVVPMLKLRCSEVEYEQEGSLIVFQPCRHKTSQPNH